MGRKINLLSKRDRKRLPEDIFTSYATRVQRAGEILQETFNNFIEDLIAHSSDPETSPVKDWEVVVETDSEGTFRGKEILSYKVYIDNPVFNILSEGTMDAVYPRVAANYGYKAWPMVGLRSKEFGGKRVTHPDSLKLTQGKSNDDKVVFRPVIYNPIQPRNFTKKLYEIAQKQIDKEGLRIKLDLTDV